MDELERPDLIEYKQADKHPIWILLDSVRSMNNVGSVFRTADAFNVEGIYLCGLTPQPPHRDIQKTALGATESVFWKHEPSIKKAIQQLKDEGYTIIGIEQTHNSQPLENFHSLFQGKIALIFGNEVSGISDEALELCQQSIEIKQWGTKHSLNISVSVGVVLWEMVRNL